MANVRDAVNAVITAIMAQKDYLTAVDAKTGDGDHGLNMARGFTAARERLAELPADAPVKDVLYHIGRAFIENVGGAAGPLYGIGFVRASEAVRAGAEYTKTIAARRGRAALIGARSIGIEDPGAMSSLIMFRALCSYLRG